jgi:hypothetical protein
MRACERQERLCVVSPSNSPLTSPDGEVLHPRLRLGLQERQALDVEEDEPPSPNMPQRPFLHTSMKLRSTTTTVAVLKKVRHNSALRQHVATSSSANSTPPTDERNAAHTPDDAPHVTRSRRSRLLLN